MPVTRLLATLRGSRRARRARAARLDGAPTSRPGGVAVTVFPTCVVEAVRPSVVDHACTALRTAGASPAVAALAGCCGQPAWNAGLADDARRVARVALRTLARTQGPVVVPSGSCATMLHEHWPRVFAGTLDERDARAVADRTVELSAFLASRPPVEPRHGGGDLDHDRPAVTYHASCHLTRHLGVHSEPLEVLRRSGHAVAEPDDDARCCGFGGTFSVKLPEVSVAMADEKLDALLATGATTVVGCDLSCLLHLDGRARARGLDLRFVHLAEAIDGAEAIDHTRRGAR
jgi:L-lactate dehydrogenase complex protein LldE